MHALGDRYEGTIEAVVEQEVRNKWTRTTTRESVIVFTDGKQLVLNRGTQFELMDRFGHESDQWVGEQIVLASRRVERTDAKTGEVLVTWEKVLLRAEGESDAEDPAPAWVTERESNGSDPISASDEDDIDAQARPFARRRRAQ